MASKEEIEKRVEQEGARVYGVFIERIQESAAQGITRGVRPLVERVIELEGKLNGSEYDRVTACEAGAQLTAKLAAADARGDDLAAALHNMTSARDQIGAQMIRDGKEIAALYAERSRLEVVREELAEKLKSAENRAIEQDRTIEVLNSDRSRLSASLTEARADLRTAQRELDEERAAKRDVLRGRTMAENTIVELRGSARRMKDDLTDNQRTIDALRAQVTALSAVIDGHEQAIRDACADVRATYETALDKTTDRCAALETTVDVLAGRLAARGA